MKTQYIVCAACHQPKPETAIVPDVIPIGNIGDPVNICTDCMCDE